MDQFVVAVCCSTLQQPKEKPQPQLKGQPQHEHGMEKAEPGFSMAYSHKVNVSYTSISLEFNKTKNFINAACVIDEFRI